MTDMRKNVSCLETKDTINNIMYPKIYNSSLAIKFFISKLYTTLDKMQVIIYTLYRNIRNLRMSTIKAITIKYFKGEILERKVPSIIAIVVENLAFFILYFKRCFLKLDLFKTSNCKKERTDCRDNATYNLTASTEIQLNQLNSFLKLSHT